MPIDSVDSVDDAEQPGAGGATDVPTGPLAVALARLAAMVSAASYPVLTDDELTVALESHQRFTVWTPGASYSVGDRVVPTVANGRVYRCLRAGDAGETEPVWYYVSRTDWRWRAALSGPYVPGPFWEDGAGPLWQDDGAVSAQSYDLRGAARDAWMMKAGKVAMKFDIASAQQSMKRSQMYDHCLRMANRYAPVDLV